MSWRLALALVAACGSATAPPSNPVEPPPPRLPEPEVRAAVTPTRTDLAVPTPPTSLVAIGGTLYWSDALGAIWTMPSSGSAPARQLSDGTAFAFHLFRAGDAVFATSRKDLLRVTSSVHALGLKLAELPEESAGDAGSLYITLFKRSEVLRIPAGGGAPAKLAEIPRGVLGIHGDTLYAASYSTGALIAVPTRGGAARTITTGLPRPTAVAADDDAAYVYCERDRSVRRIELATGATRVIARELDNSDDLVSDGADLWTISWGSQPGLVRIKKDGSAPAVRVTNDVRRPTKLAVDADAIYVSSRDESRIVRIPRASLR